MRDALLCYEIEICLGSVDFMHCEIIALFLTHCEFCEYKDQSLVKQMCSAWFFFSFISWIFDHFKPFLAVISDVSDDAFYWLPHKKKHWFIVAECFHFIWLIEGIIIDGLPSCNLFSVQPSIIFLNGSSKPSSVCPGSKECTWRTCIWSSDFLNTLSLINVVYEGRRPNLSQCYKMWPLLYSLITRRNQINVELVLESIFS